MSILNIPTAGTLQGTGFNFINDITTANQSILASIDLNSPNPPTTNIEMIHPSFECIKDMDIEAYHQHGYISSSMFSTNRDLTEREIQHRAKAAIKAKQQARLQKNQAVKKGKVIHELLERIIKKGLRSNVPLVDFLKVYEVAPSYDKRTKKGVQEGYNWYCTKVADNILEQFQLIAEDEPTVMKRQQRVIQLIKDSYPYFVDPETFGYLKSLIEEINRLSHISPLLQYGQSEWSLFNHDTNVRIRPDVLVPAEVFGHLLHISIKSTSDLRRFKGSFHQRGYDIQEGMYNYEIGMATQQSPISIFLIIECKKDGLVQIKLEEVSEQSILKWHNRYLDELDKYKAVLEKTDATGYEVMFGNAYGVEVV